MFSFDPWDEKSKNEEALKMQRYDFGEFMGRYTILDELDIFDALEDLPDLGPGGPWLAGCAIRRTLLGTPLDSDLDFFFANEGQLSDFRTKLLAMGASKVSSNDHVETYSTRDRLIQLVKIGFYASAEEVLDSFDFTITQLAYDGKDLIVGEFTLWDLARKKLALHKLTFGVATMRRLLKYVKQDFTACAGVMASILEAVVADPTTIQRETYYVD